MAQLLSGNLELAGGLGLLKGGTHSVGKWQPTGINAGGFNIGWNRKNKQFMGTTTPERMGYLQSLSGLYGQQAQGYKNLLGTVAPGFSNMRQARLAQIENARQQSVGNLQQNLSRRRMLGSSFGQDALSRANAEFSNQKQQAIADSYMKELAATQQLMSEQYNAGQNAINVFLNNMNMEARMAGSFVNQANAALSKNAQVQASILGQAGSDIMGMGLSNMDATAQNADKIAMQLLGGMMGGM
jgi:hypothetical protein